MCNAMLWQRHGRYLFMGLLLSVISQLSAAEEKLEEIIVNSTRIEKPLNQIPSAVSVITQDDIQTARQQLALDESLVRVPGLYMQDRYNYGQNLRIAIRGFGSRATFGIRGIQLIVDGVPATLPDGQSGVNNIDIGSIGRIEVIRGPSASLYGSSAGGVINIYTEDGPQVPFLQGQYAMGDDDYSKYQVKAGGQYEKLNYLVNVSRLTYDGYRQHSYTENTTLNSKFKYNIDATSDFTAIINFTDNPINEDAGGLNAKEVAANRSQARAANLTFNAGKSVEQESAGFVYHKKLGDYSDISLDNYYVWRDFENLLAFNAGGNVQFQRFFVGGGGQYKYSAPLFGHDNVFLLGFEVESQNDDRQRFNNINGVKGAMTVNQLENVDSLGVFLQDDLQLAEQLGLSFSLRYDKVDFDVTDRFLSDGNDSGTLGFDSLDPMVALIWSPLHYLNLYAKYSTSFETPTTTELANPDNTGGFNPNLSPTRAYNYELGAKGQLPNSLSYELALFHIDVENELIVYTLAAFPGHNFYRNAGKSTREGVETAISFQPVEHLTVSANYTYSDFVYDTYRTLTAPIKVYDGNTIPGLPSNQFYTELNYQHPSGLYAIWDLLWTGALYTNDANTAKDNVATVSNLRVGYKGEWGKWNISPFVGLNNLLDEKYNQNIRINDATSRYYEPAPLFNAYAGLSIRYRFE